MVRTFLSYSRQDAVFVMGVAEALERRGIDVWLDTDDIRGSEPWRRSIVDAITSADAVVLVVSWASMASKNVEREITVAAEVHRRIVPVVIEAAPLPAGLQYELAGVQQVIAMGRLLDKVVDDLEVALRGVGAPPSLTRSDPVALLAATRRSAGTPRRSPPAGLLSGSQRSLPSASWASPCCVVAAGTTATLTRPPPIPPPARPIRRWPTR